MVFTASASLQVCQAETAPTAYLSGKKNDWPFTNLMASTSEMETSNLASEKLDITCSLLFSSAVMQGSQASI